MIRWRIYGHASHEACELKFSPAGGLCPPVGHASHEACELKFPYPHLNLVDVFGHASHEACELKSALFLLSGLVLPVTPRMRRVS